METTITLGILHHTIAFFVKLPAIGKILICTLSKVILIYKVAIRYNKLCKLKTA